MGKFVGDFYASTGVFFTTLRAGVVAHKLGFMDGLPFAEFNPCPVLGERLFAKLSGRHVLPGNKLNGITWLQHPRQADRNNFELLMKDESVFFGTIRGDSVDRQGKVDEPSFTHRME